MPISNLKTDRTEDILNTYRPNRSPVRHIRATVPTGKMVRACGNPYSRRLFTEWDYKNLIHNRYCRINGKTAASR